MNFSVVEEAAETLLSHCSLNSYLVLGNISFLVMEVLAGSTFGT